MTPHRPVWLDLDGTHNVRDLAGLRTRDGRRVRPGVLLRGDHLENLTEEGAARLRDETGLRLVVDLRWHTEGPRAGAWTTSPAGRGVERMSLPLVDLTQSNARVGEVDGDERLVALYRVMLENAGPSLAHILHHVTETPGRLPVLVHCAAGKDRTGIAVAVLLGAAGVDDAEIMADYVATGERLPRIRAALAARTGNPYRLPEEEAVPGPLPEAPLRAVLDALDDAGGAAAFLRHHGVPDETLERWRGLLLEGTQEQ